MAHDDSDHEASAVERGPDYKMLFLGACSIIVIIGGLLVGYWNSSSDDAKRAHVAQGQRISDLADRTITLSADVETLKEVRRDTEERLRNLERRVYWGVK